MSQQSESAVNQKILSVIGSLCAGIFTSFWLLPKIATCVWTWFIVPAFHCEPITHFQAFAGCILAGFIFAILIVPLVIRFDIKKTGIGEFTSAISVILAWFILWLVFYVNHLLVGLFGLSQ